MKQSNKQRLRMYAGNLSGLYGIRDIVFNDGRGKGVRAIEMRSDKGMECTILIDRCMDIPYVSFKGINIGLVTKVGISSSSYYIEDGVRGFLKQFFAGMLTTCGIVSSGAPGNVDEINYGLHGNISNTPAENISLFESSIDNEIALCITGKVREVCVFGESLELHRSIRMLTEQNTLCIDDNVENCGFEDYPMMNLYHINFGYPMLDAGARCYFSTPDVTPRDADAKAHMKDYALIEDPEIGRPEECFIHTGASGSQFAMLHNERLGIAAVVHYDADALPYLCQWKCCHAGDYALGLEPSVAGFWGLAYAREHGIVKYLQPGQSTKLSMRIELVDDVEKITKYKLRCKENR